MRLGIIDKIDDELDENFFLTWWRTGNEERKSDESRFIDFWKSIFTEPVFVLLEEPHEEKGTDPLVPI